ncbi:MAG TPA: hypothetical protein VK453_27230 [Micromonosporaceae bacterium]|nr:hypothetical protein [Micromonosporaceae bacterium]
MTRPTRRIATLAGLSLVGAGGALSLALATGPAFAEDPTASPSSSTSSSSSPSESGSPSASGSASASAKPDREAQRTQRQSELAAALAKELGVDQAKVAAALEKVHAEQQSKHDADRVADLKTRLDAAVKEGQLTAEQSAAILKAAEAGVLPGGRGRGHGGGFPGR